MKTQILELSDPLWIEILKQFNHDIYHLPEYLYLESIRTQTIPEAILIVENDRVFFFPYLLRISNVEFKKSNLNLTTAKVVDAISPYGYPGLLLNEAAEKSPKFIKSAMNEFMSTLKAKDVCSAFLRLHPILNKGLDRIFSTDVCRLTGETVSVNLQLSQAEIWQQTRSGHRNKINRCKRRGLKAEIVNLQDNLADFIDIYEETMDRVKADKIYYFNNFYFSYLSTELAHKTHLAIVKLDDEITCAGLFTECNGIVQYHLGGTKNQYLKEAPNKLMFDYVRYWAKERGNKILHLGGGLGGSKNDNLHRFKAGFSKQRHTYLTMRLITDEKKYFAFTALQAKTLNITSEELLKFNFFPAYRYRG